jgi:hypothetical protein
MLAAGSTFGAMVYFHSSAKSKYIPGMKFYGENEPNSYVTSGFHLRKKIQRILKYHCNLFDCVLRHVLEVELCVGTQKFRLFLSNVVSKHK